MTLNGFITTKRNVSIHYHIKPNNKSLAYFTALKFRSNPYLNSTHFLFDLWNIFCPKDLRTESNESFYVFFVNMSHTIDYKGFVGFGVKELNEKEFKYFCQGNETNLTHYLDRENRANLSSEISTRVILSGCYYADKLTGIYSSYGMEILETTNTTHTQCKSNHLTQFAGGWLTVPSGINFDDVFAHASFLDNITIYMTVIVISTLYITLSIWTQHMDKKDELKTTIRTLPEIDDIYFYEIIFYTGSGLNAGTHSNVNICTLFLFKINTFFIKEYFKG